MLDFINEFVNSNIEIITKMYPGVSLEYIIENSKDVCHNLNYLIYTHAEIINDCDIKNYDTIGMTLTYKILDNLSWIYENDNCIRSYSKSKNPVINFINEFQVIPRSCDVTPEEIWSSRNALLHSNTYESNDTKKMSNSIRQVIFFSRIKDNKDKILNEITRDFIFSGDYTFLDISEFQKNLYGVLDKMLKKIILNGYIIKVNTKIKKMPFFYHFLNL